MPRIRTNWSSTGDFQSGDWLFQPSLHRATNGKDTGHLEPKLVGVLVCLVEHAGQAVSKDDLLAAVWPDAIVEEIALTRSISELRRIVGDDARTPRYIETISKLGYRWIAEVKPVEAQNAPRRPLVRSAIAMIAIIAAAIVAIMLGRSTLSRRQPKAVAVLPFANLTGSADQEYLADGVTEQLTTDLARLRTIRVTSRTSAMTYKAAKKPLPEIARALGVDSVVEGSISRAGNRLRITVQFIDAETDKHLYSQTFECDPKDILTTESEVAAAIAETIGAGVAPRRSHSIHPEAYRAYISGEYFLNKRGEADLEKAVENFTRALDDDPTSAPAYAGLSSAYAQLGYFNYLPPADAFPKAKAAALKAIDLDAASAEAHASLGYIHMYYDWDFAAAESEFRRAIALNPSLAVAHEYYSVYLAAMLRPAEAEQEAVRARVLDPLSVLVATDMGFILYYDRAYDRAAAVLRDAIAMNPKTAGAHFWLGRVYQAEKRYTEAAAEYRAGGRGVAEWPPALGGLGHMYAVLGQRADAQHELDELSAMSRTRYVTPYATTLVYLGLADKTRTLDLLEQCYAERVNWLVWLLRDPR